MADKGTELTLCVLAGIGVVTLLYAISQKTDDSVYVPSNQKETQVLSLGNQAGMSVNAGTPLDTNHPDHFWHPGYDPDPSAQPVTQSKHRYPALPGGNISTVIHRGWSSMTQKAPADWEWQLNPPEAAVI
jgi:hypothetical protein